MSNTSHGGMLRNRKPIPITFAIVSVLYFIYVVSSGSSKMIGDEIGGDPGGMLLPMVLSAFMFFASVYLFITDKRDESSKPRAMTREERQLFVLTVCGAIGYVLLSRVLGFVLCTVLLLFILCFANMRKGLRRADAMAALLGCGGSLVSLLGLYSLCRVVTRSLLIAGRRGTIPSWLGSTTTTAALSMVITVIVVVAAIVLLRRIWPNSEQTQRSHDSWYSAVIAVATTEILYLVFKQLFLVELVKGPITW